MNKVHFFLVFIFLLTSCNQKPAGKRISTGEINHIAIIIDDQLWNGEIGDNVRSKFAAPVIGLAQEEPIFSINQYPAKLLEGYMTHSRNIIVIKKLKILFIYQCIRQILKLIGYGRVSQTVPVTYRQANITIAMIIIVEYKWGREIHLFKPKVITEPPS